mmetsp:Transcript_17261/g.49075  ORF Transcript_17261/g.49075 Transcript_17261/m.49075 type:complete len:229 (+) Transcript_17261:53-739(+)
MSSDRYFCQSWSSIRLLVRPLIFGSSTFVPALPVALAQWRITTFFGWSLLHCRGNANCGRSATLMPTPGTSQYATWLPGSEVLTAGQRATVLFPKPWRARPLYSAAVSLPLPGVISVMFGAWLAATSSVLFSVWLARVSLLTLLEFVRLLPLSSSTAEVFVALSPAVLVPLGRGAAPISDWFSLALLALALARELSFDGGLSFPVVFVGSMTRSSSTRAAASVKLRPL